MSTTNGKRLRFAALIRVSTEKQERRGESLRTQATQIDHAVATLGGKIVSRYAGQEHATTGFEREQLGRLLDDAGKPRPPFDAVIVADATRWSRDNAASKDGLKILRDARIRFYVLTTEYDLFNTEARLFLGLTAEIGEYHAQTQKTKSLQNRIERAKRGMPTGGKIPFGRVWDGEKQTWSVDPKKQAMIEDVATRYLAGEALPKLAKKHGVNHSALCKTLRERCGEHWSIAFRADDLDICETVTMRVPRLLPEGTIRQVHHRLAANRTYIRSGGQPKHEYLLSGRVFCMECGYNMTGQTNHNGHQYYRHAHREKAADCPLHPRPWIRADAIEADILRDLFNLFGNPAEIERAVKAAIPDCDKALRQQERIEAELAKIDHARNRLLTLIVKDAITEGQAEVKLHELKEREADYRSQFDKIAATLTNVPNADAVRVYVQRVGEAIVLYDDHGDTHPGGNDLATFLMMDRADRRKLIDSVFSSPLYDGSPAGVYITPAGGDPHGRKRFSYELRGRLIGDRRVMPRSWR